MKLLITGTNRGIGAYLTNHLQKNHEIIGISQNANTNTSIHFFQCDITNDAQMDGILQNIENIDYMILNAWIGFFDRFENISLEDHIKVIETNLIANIKLCYKLLKKIEKGIIFIGSISSKKSAGYGASYAASKFWLRGFAMQLKNECKGKKIFLINPKIVATEFHRQSSIDIQGKYPHTDIDDILQTVENILQKKETRFEIDL